MVLFCNLIGSSRSRHRKSTAFLASVNRLSPPPIIEDRAWEQGYLFPPADVIFRFSPTLPGTYKPIPHSLFLTAKRKLVLFTTYLVLFMSRPDSICCLKVCQSQQEKVYFMNGHTLSCELYLPLAHACSSGRVIGLSVCLSVLSMEFQQ